MMKWNSEEEHVPNFIHQHVVLPAPNMSFHSYFPAPTDAMRKGKSIGTDGAILQQHTKSTPLVLSNQCGIKIHLYH